MVDMKKILAEVDADLDKEFEAAAKRKIRDKKAAIANAKRVVANLESELAVLIETLAEQCAAT
jgi:hypothetical protein